MTLNFRHQVLERILVLLSEHFATISVPNGNSVLLKRLSDIINNKEVNVVRIACTNENTAINFVRQTLQFYKKYRKPLAIISKLTKYPRRKFTYCLNLVNNHNKIRSGQTIFVRSFKKPLISIKSTFLGSSLRDVLFVKVFKKFLNITIKRRRRGAKTVTEEERVNVAVERWKQNFNSILQKYFTEHKHCKFTYVHITIIQGLVFAQRPFTFNILNQSLCDHRCVRFYRKMGIDCIDALSGLTCECEPSCFTTNIKNSENDLWSYILRRMDIILFTKKRDCFELHDVFIDDVLTTSKIIYHTPHLYKFMKYLIKNRILTSSPLISLAYYVETCNLPNFRFLFKKKKINYFNQLYSEGNILYEYFKKNVDCIAGDDEKLKELQCTYNENGNEEKVVQRLVDYEWIDTRDTYLKCLEAIWICNVIGMDTENDIYNRLAIVQIATRDKVYIIDYQSPNLNGLQDLRDLLCNHGIKIVGFGIANDLKLLFRDSTTNRKYGNVIDLQSMYKGQGSLKEIVKDKLDITLDKRYQMSNFGDRPLTQEQLLYAANDVDVLLSLYATNT